jgi:hypothetical protein
VTTWNSGDLSNITLSNGNLTAANTTTANAFVRGTTSTSSGKVYFEMTWLQAGSFADAGIANAAYDVGQNVPGFDSGANSAAIVPVNAAFQVAGSNLGQIGASIQANDTVAFCYDLPNKLFWGRIWRSGAWAAAWNGDASPGDPAAGTGGLSFSSLNAGPWFLVFGGQSSGDSVTMNPGPSGFITAMPPSGFSAWDAAAPTYILMGQACL